MFIKSDIFDRLLCCRRKIMIDDDNEEVVQEEMVLQHTNNNKTEFITSSQLLERLKGGTTAVVALIREKRLVVAWLGDSQALLVRKRTAVQIVLPHKPEKETERKRIEDQGGCVVNIQGTWRVLGQLAVSRAIGDVDYKPFVSAECDIKSLEISGDEDFLVLACDGLWDTLEPENVVNIVYSYLLKNSGDTDGVGRCLVEAARVAGSEDNITAVVVFLRPVNILMEEESGRIEQGQVPEMDSFVMTQKDALPPSINAIFCQPSNLNPESPPFTPFEQSNVNLKNGNIEHPQDVIQNDILPNASVPQEVIIHDSDSDEGVGADIAAERGKQQSPEEEAAAAPTEEEVDAALAELDSLPDGIGDTGDIDEEDEDEGWAYYKMEPQNEAKKEDVIGTESTEEKPVSKEFDSPPASRPIDVTKIVSPAGSPKEPSSPRAVEGFVTSVDLNTPEESYNTNLTINQNTEYFNGGASLEQNSGPFSVYVSSSPEPASMDTPAVQTQALMTEDSDEGQSPPSPSVEIVHAQSTVEVSTEEQSSSPIPDIMSQSMTGGNVFSEAVIPSPDVVLCRDSSPTFVEDVEETTRNFEELVSQAKQFEDLIGQTDTTFTPMTASITENTSTFMTEPDLQTEQESIDHHTISEESSMLINELENSVNGVSSVVANAQIPEEVLPTEAPQILDEDKTRFTNQISKAFDAPLDEMMVSYHEDQNPLSDIIQINSSHSVVSDLITESVTQLELIDELVSSPPEADQMEVPSPVEQLIQVELITSPVEPSAEIDECLLSPVEQVTQIEDCATSPIDVIANLITSPIEPVVQIEERIPSPVEPVVQIERIPSPVEPVVQVEERIPSEENILSSAEPVDQVEEHVQSPVEPIPKIEESVEKPSVNKLSPPKPSPRTVGTKTTTLKPKLAAPLPASRSTPSTKKPAAPKSALTKSVAPKPTSSTTSRPGSTAASKPATTLRSRLTASSGGTSRTTSVTTSRLSAKPTTTLAPRSKSSSATTVTRTTSSSAARTKVTTATSTKPSTIPPTRTSLVPPRKAPASTSTTKPKTATSRLTTDVSSAVSKAPSRTTGASTTTSRLAASSTLTKKTTTTERLTPRSATSTTTTRKPMTTRPTSATKPIGSTTATKDTKNTTNKILSTSRTSTTTSRTLQAKSAATRTITSTQNRFTHSKTNKSSSLKTKLIEVKKDDQVLTESLANGEEKKIVEEESSIEVKEKLMEDLIDIDDPTTQEGITKETQVLVNGDH